MEAPYLLSIVHVPWERPGTIASAAGRQGFRVVQLNSADLEVGDDLHTASKKAGESYLPSGLVVMGGPMSVYEHASYPWITAELDLIRRAADSQTPVLGVCLGAQMIAGALGAAVYEGDRGTEIGFGKVQLTEEGCKHRILGAAISPSGASASSASDTAIPVFHWHGDTFDIPDGCIRLAESELYPNQAFCGPDGVLALQFHLEVDRNLFSMWSPHLPKSLDSGYQKDGPSIPEEPNELEAAIAAVAEVGNRVFDEYFSSFAS